MVKILVCEDCKKLETFPLCSTYRNIIYGCKHSIKDLDEEVRTTLKQPNICGDSIVIIDRPKPIVRKNNKRF